MTAAEVMALISATEKPYYCYVLREPNGIPFYVGVGKKLRLFDHERDARNPVKSGPKLLLIRDLSANNQAIDYEIVGYGLIPPSAPHRSKD